MKYYGLSIGIFLFSLNLFSQEIIKGDSLKTKTTAEVLLRSEVRDLMRLQALDGLRINAGKKNEIIQFNALNADLSTNNYRQIMAKVPGISIWENDGSGIQTSVASRGLSPNRSWEFNVRMNGADISSEAYGYPEAYFTPPAEALEKLEIIRGASALQYGTQFGGVMNYVTKKSIGNKPFALETQQTIGSNGLFNAYNAIGGKFLRTLSNRIVAKSSRRSALDAFLRIFTPQKCRRVERK